MQSRSVSAADFPMWNAGAAGRGPTRDHICADPQSANTSLPALQRRSTAFAAYETAVRLHPPAALQILF
jgi:hypothetical protein